MLAILKQQVKNMSLAIESCYGQRCVPVSVHCIHAYTCRGQVSSNPHPTSHTPPTHAHTHTHHGRRAGPEHLNLRI